MMAYYKLYLLASTYGSGAYNSGNYNNTTATGSSSGGGSLTNTGIAIIAIVTLAALILLVAMAVRIWKRPSKQTVPVESDDSTDVTQ